MAYGHTSVFPALPTKRIATQAWDADLKQQDLQNNARRLMATARHVPTSNPADKAALNALAH